MLTILNLDINVAGYCLVCAPTAQDTFYPPELELKKTTESHDSCSYLDLNISILNGKFCTDLYDKRDTFSFSIVNFPHMDSNIPSKPAYGVVISQLVRYLRILLLLLLLLIW